MKHIVSCEFSSQNIGYQISHPKHLTVPTRDAKIPSQDARKEYVGYSKAYI